MAGVWKRTLVYLGLAEEDEEFEEQPMEDAPLSRDEPTQMVRTLPRDEARRSDTHPAGRGIVRPMPAVGPSPKQVHLVEPRIYDDAQEFADKFKQGIPVIVNLRGTDSRHGAKILHFASGLVYGLNGRMKKVGEHVYLITPYNVEVSADEKRRLAEHGLVGEF